jgi:hypothetical protein
MAKPEAGEGLRKLEDRYAGYDIIDPASDKIGTAGGAFVDEDNPLWEYVEVKGGLLQRALGTGYYLLPMGLCTVNHERKTLQASVDKATVEDSPYLDSALEVTRDHALGVRSYYGL